MTESGAVHDPSRPPAPVPANSGQSALRALRDRAKGMYPKGGTGHAVLTFLNFVEQAGRPNK